MPCQHDLLLRRASWSSTPHLIILSYLLFRITLRYEALALSIPLWSCKRGRGLKVRVKTHMALVYQQAGSALRPRQSCSTP